MSSVGSVRRVPISDQKIEDFSMNSTNISSLPQFSALHSDKNCQNLSHSHDSLRISFSDKEIDMDNLPKPTMPKKSEDDLKLYRKKSCENSFDEDMDEVKSLPDTNSTESESKA